jgi:pimeloyl-ACP methyl ester carboxylesterase
VLFALALAPVAGTALAEDDFVRFGRSPCASVESPPPLHCPDQGCDSATVINPGPAVEAKSRRTYFLDYPCNLARGEKVTFLLSLHGGGSYANWQRHYFPLLDYVEQYRLVVATPSSPTQVWSEADDGYLQGIVEAVYSELGAENVGAFWIVGHSQGGQTANRLLTTDFFRERLDGFLSLSGGRLGSKREEVRATIPRGSVSSMPQPPPAGSSAPGPRLTADASILPDYPFSHIYSSGEHELTDAGLPGESKWAVKLGCGAQQRAAVVVDTRGGYVYDARPRENRNPIWGLDPGPGRAEIYVYPGCDGGRIVADVVRLGKGHTEGFEPRVTEAILELVLSAGESTRD